MGGAIVVPSGPVGPVAPDPVEELEGGAKFQLVKLSGRQPATRKRMDKIIRPFSVFMALISTP